jgi:hypothetical protein
VNLPAMIRHRRVAQAGPFPQPASDSLRRIQDASPPLPVVIGRLDASEPGRAPAVGEIWRVGGSEAMLVWIRRVLDDGVADVIPVVLDVDLADAESIIVPADATCLGVELAAMVALRTHVHCGAFLAHVDTLDIADDVAEVMAATREGWSPRRVRVGPPIVDGRDQRIEYRQAIRDIFGEIMPSVWEEDGAQ